MMEIKDLTEEIVTPIIRELVSEFGADYVYKKEEREALDINCAYQENGKPSCIVGHILDRAGVHYDPGWEDHACWSVLSHQGVPHVLISALDEAQAQQDSGKTWGEALNAYEERVRV